MPTDRELGVETQRLTESGVVAEGQHIVLWSVFAHGVKDAEVTWFCLQDTGGPSQECHGGISGGPGWFGTNAIGQVLKEAYFELNEKVDQATISFRRR